MPFCTHVIQISCFRARLWPSPITWWWTCAPAMRRAWYIYIYSIPNSFPLHKHIFKIQLCWWEPYLRYHSVSQFRFSTKDLTQTWTGQTVPSQIKLSLWFFLDHLQAFFFILHTHQCPGCLLLPSLSSLFLLVIARFVALLVFWCMIELDECPVRVRPLGVWPGEGGSS